MEQRTASDECRAVATDLRDVLEDVNLSSALKPLAKLEQAAKIIGKASSNSSLGYHSLVYYRDFEPPPSGAVFSPEYGLMLYRGAMRHMRTSLGTQGDWVQYTADEVTDRIYELAGEVDFDGVGNLAERVYEHFESNKATLLSIIEIEARQNDFINGLKSEVGSLVRVSRTQLASQWIPDRPCMSRDSTAMTQGQWIAPHIEVLAGVRYVNFAIELCSQIAKIADIIAAHLDRETSYQQRLRQNAMGHEDFQTTATLDHHSSVNFNQKKQRYEATATTCENMGYGKTQQEAFAMLTKIITNHVRKRPELENLEEHENYREVNSNLVHNNVTHIHNHQGVVNTGSMEQVTVSISNLRHAEPGLAENLQKLVKAIQESMEISEEMKSEVLDRTDIITVEANKQPEKRLMHRVKDNISGLTDTLKGAAALKALWDTVEPLIKGHFGL